jgi:hypothetical protein
MILACRVLRSLVGPGSYRSQRADGIFGTYRLDRSAPRARLTRAHPSLGAHHEACQSCSDSTLDRGRSALVTDRWSTARAAETCSLADGRAVTVASCGRSVAGCRACILVCHAGVHGVGSSRW